MAGVSKKLKRTFEKHHLQVHFKPTNTIVGLEEGVEGDDPLGFIQNHLRKWIPSLLGKVRVLDRAHCIYSKNRCCVIEIGMQS